MFLVFYVSLVDAVESAAGKVAKRASGRDPESGQGALEYVGMLLVVAGVIVVLVSTDLGDRLQAQISKIITDTFGAGGGSP